MLKIIPFSVIVIAGNRIQQVNNLLQSISESEIKPYDIQLIRFNNETKNKNFGLLSIETTTIYEDGLPLAFARNLGASLAKTENLIFLDADCIVSPTLFHSILSTLKDGLVVSAYPLYLSQVPPTGTYSLSLSEAISHPSRENIQANVPIKATKFWSLAFGITKKDFYAICGFDESFIGYGGEDTDFAMSFDTAGIHLMFVKDHVLHQYHTKYDPPLNYFESIVKNAETFKQKWGYYPMQSWLNAFLEKGLIGDYVDVNRITIKRMPSEQEIKECLSKNPY